MVDRLTADDAGAKGLLTAMTVRSGPIARPLIAYLHDRFGTPESQMSVFVSVIFRVVLAYLLTIAANKE